MKKIRINYYNKKSDVKLSLNYPKMDMETLYKITSETLRLNNDLVTFIIYEYED